MSFGVELGRLMLERGVSFRELARRTGLAAGTLNQYANGRRRPPDDERLQAIARGLGAGPEVFFEWRRRRALEQLRETPQLVEAIYARQLARPR